MLHIRQFICNNKHLLWQSITGLWNTTRDKTIRLSPINITTEGSGLAWDFSFNLFGLLMIGYPIPISLSCSFPSCAPCCSLEDCFGEHLEEGCWIDSFLQGPCAPASALGAWTLSHGPQRRESERVSSGGWGGGRNEKEALKKKNKHSSLR